MRQAIIAIAVYAVTQLFLPSLWERFMSTAPGWVLRLVLFTAAVFCVAAFALSEPVYSRLSSAGQFPLSSTTAVVAIVGLLAGAAWWIWVVHPMNQGGKWKEGDPIPRLDDFPITVRTNVSPTLAAYSAVHEEPQRQSNLFVIAHGLTLTNVSNKNVVVFLELIFPRPDGRLVSVSAELDDPPLKIGDDGRPVRLEALPAGTQIRRTATIPAHDGITGFAVFRLSERELDGRFGTRPPFHALNDLSMDEKIQFGTMLMQRTLLRVTNQLDGSYRDYWPLKQSAAPARQFINETR